MAKELVMTGKINTKGFARSKRRDKDDETEKVFIDFVVCGDDYLADIAKDYWEDVK